MRAIFFLAPPRGLRISATCARGRFVQSAKSRRFRPPAREKLGRPASNRRSGLNDLGLSNRVVRIKGKPSKRQSPLEAGFVVLMASQRGFEARISLASLPWEARI
jgi:hypothetical protein